MDMRAVLPKTVGIIMFTTKDYFKDHMKNACADAPHSVCLFVWSYVTTSVDE